MEKEERRIGRKTSEIGIKIQEECVITCNVSTANEDDSNKTAEKTKE
jgi:hypothetical protein